MLLLNGMAIVTGLMPALLAIIAALIMRNFPITPEVREDMRKLLAAREEND